MPTMAGAGPPAIALASSPDGRQFQSVNGGAPVLVPSACSYCSGALSFPAVVPDVLAGVPDGGTPPQVMFFSAAALLSGAVSIGRASSMDGISWTPEPAPILSSDRSGELVLLSPRVLVDGSVYKMWYSFATMVDTKYCLYNPTNPTMSSCPTGWSCQPASCSLPPCLSTCTTNDVGDVLAAFCEPNTTVEIGYATSADGFFWTKSTKNPVLSLAQDNEAGIQSLLATSVLPADGTQAQNGITLYYSVFRRRNFANGVNRCTPDLIRRASRP
jgi:hypothetical protein